MRSRVGVDFFDFPYEAAPRDTLRNVAVAASVGECTFSGGDFGAGGCSPGAGNATSMLAELADAADAELPALASGGAASSSPSFSSCVIPSTTSLCMANG